MEGIQVPAIGIVKTLETLDDLGNLAVNVIQIYKAGGPAFGVIFKVIEALKNAAELVSDAKAALPELSDIDAQEASQLGTAAFALVKKVISAV